MGGLTFSLLLFMIHSVLPIEQTRRDYYILPPVVGVTNAPLLAQQPAQRPVQQPVQQPAQKPGQPAGLLRPPNVLLSEESGRDFVLNGSGNANHAAAAAAAAAPEVVALPVLPALHLPRRDNVLSPVNNDAILLSSGSLPVVFQVSADIHGRPKAHPEEDNNAVYLSTPFKQYAENLTPPFSSNHLDASSSSSSNRRRRNRHWRQRHRRRRRQRRLRHGGVALGVAGGGGGGGGGAGSGADLLTSSSTRQHLRGARLFAPRQQRARSYADPSENPGLMRSLLGVSPFCLSADDRQFSCTFTPACWLSGGTPQPGCDSILYSCCVHKAEDEDHHHDTPRALGSAAPLLNLAPGIGGGATGGVAGVAVVGALMEDVLEQNDPDCGLTRQSAFSKRIIGGERAKFAELPWQVHIRISSYQCGGVLLNHWYVATAAHCVHQAKLSQITIHLGEYDTKDTEKVSEPLDSESFTVSRITLHPDFRYMLTQPDRFDVALLRLDRPVYYRENIIPICLPTREYPLEGKVGVVAGWGKTDNSFGKTGTNLLNKVLVPIINNRKCRVWHKEKAISVQLHDEMFCAGHREGRRDACLGDSGGPLVINFDGRWTLIGITSAGFGCAVEKQPGIYHKVSTTARWIASKIKKP